MKTTLLLFILIFFLGILVGKFLLNRIFIKNKRIIEVKKNILEKKEPYSPEEVKLYIQVIDKYRSQRPVCAWGNYLLLKYYMNICVENKEVLSKCLEIAEKVRTEFKEYSFYEDALFILGNIYFFELLDFNLASEVYTQLMEERKNTRWKSICQDRVDLISNSAFDEEALKLYVFAEKYFEESKFEDAEFYLKEVIKRYPKAEIAASASYFLGDIYYYKYNDLDSALKFYLFTNEKFPSHQLAQPSLYKAGEIMRKVKQWDEAIIIYRKYIKHFKDSPYRDDAHYYVGECFQNMGKLREAKNSYNLILGDYPNSKWTDVIYRKVLEINNILKEL